MKRRYEPIPHYLNPDLKPHMLYALVLAGIIYFDEKSAKWHFKEEEDPRLTHDINNIWMKCSKFLCGFQKGRARIEHL